MESLPRDSPRSIKRGTAERSACPESGPAEGASRFYDAANPWRVFLDGKPAGEVRFPGGRLEITEHAKPGEQQTLTILATARPLEELATSDRTPARGADRARIALRGITGDVYLLCEPKQDALGDMQVITSTGPARSR